MFIKQNIITQIKIKFYLTAALITLFYWSFAQDSISKKCNGLTCLCNKKYNEVIFPGTHNSFNYAHGKHTFLYPNQPFPVAQQLKDGIRSFMIDVHYYNGILKKRKKKLGNTILVQHQFSFLGHEKFTKVLDEFYTFLKTNPNEVVTIIFEDHTNVNDLITTIKSHPVFQFIAYQQKDSAWKTLGEMINKNERLVCFDYDADNNENWLLKSDDFCFENDYNNWRKHHYKETIIHSDTSKSLFVFNHFIYAYLSRKIQNRKVNQYDVLKNRILDSKKRFGKMPNFITVDWYNKGNLFKVCNDLNLENCAE